MCGMCVDLHLHFAITLSAHITCIDWLKFAIKRSDTERCFCLFVC